MSKILTIRDSATIFHQEVHSVAQLIRTFTHSEFLIISVIRFWKYLSFVFEHIWIIFVLKLVIEKMGEAKRREELGLPPREKKVVKEDSKSNLNQILNKYPYFPYILGISLLTILIIDLVNYYK